MTKKKINNKFENKVSLFRLLIAIFFCVFISYGAGAQNLLHVSPDATFYVSPSATMTVDGDASVSANGYLYLDDSNYFYLLGSLNNSGSFTTSSGTFYLSGNFTNGGYFGCGSGLFFLDGASSQTFTSSNTMSFYNLILTKTGGNLILNSHVKILDKLRLITSSLVDIKTKDLMIDESADIFTDWASSEDFDENRCISSSSGTTSGALVREVASGNPAVEVLEFPLGTPGVYTPATITLNNAVFSDEAFVGVKQIALEHPEVEKEDVSLTKYWSVSSNSVTIPDDGADLVFYYDPTEVEGNEGSYKVLYYSPAYPDPSGSWDVDPANFNQVLFNQYRFFSQEADAIDGDWTAGEEVAALSTYYSRADGDYNDNTTWSKEGFGGAVSPTAPGSAADKVYIDDNTVTINEAISPVNILEARDGSKLVINGDYAITGDTARIEADAVLEIAHNEGISESDASGAIQTDVRDLSSDVVYIYSGSFTQTSGDGLPDDVRSIVVDKSNSSTMTMGKIVTINDSLVINSGSLDLDNYSLNGTTDSRTFTMRGGELIVRSSFPVDYLAPTLSSGTITFSQSGSGIFTTIPSSGSTPAVNQYNHLRIKGNRTGASSITFAPEEEIRILESLDISELDFDAAIPRFNTDGSTVVFKKDGGVQDIPMSPGLTSDSACGIQYYNLKIEGDGTKRLSSPFDPTFIALNDLTLESGTFTSNGYNLEVDGDWKNNGAIFNPNSDAVIFRATDPTITNYIRSGSVSDNPFNHVTIAGSGEVIPANDLLLQGNLIIESSSNLTISSTTVTSLEIKGNWTNSGDFSPASSTVSFTGSTSQTMTNSGDNETFYDLTVDNSLNGVDASSVGPDANYGVIVNNLLDLRGGNLRTRGRYAKVIGDLTRPGAAPGHIDGSLRKEVSANSTTITYEVGYETSYTPVVLEINGSGGSQGYLQVTADTLTTVTSPISTNGSNLLPAGSNIDDDKSVRRQWGISVPTSSSFSLSDRTYDINNYFIAGANPNGDYRNGADPSLFETRLLVGSDWTGPDRYGSPKTGTRDNDYTEFRELSEFGAYVVGEPDHLSFFSISSGSWSEPSNWSTQNYYGEASSIAPTDDGYVYVGNSKTITLFEDKTVDGKVTIDSLGVLMCEDYSLSGTGDFYLYVHGALGIGDADGIASSGATGAVQTSTREYNYDSHDRGYFIYTGSVNNQATGDGLPSRMATLTVDKSGGSTLRLTNDINVYDSLSIVDGELLAREPGGASATDVTLFGNMFLTSSGTFSPYQGEFWFSGNTSQTVTAINDMSFYDLKVNNETEKSQIKFKPASGGSQNITIDNTLIFTSTNEAYLNLSPTVSTFTQAPDYNEGEWFITIDQSATGVARLGNGYVNGELRKWIPADDFSEIMFEVGHDTIYSPFAYDLDVAGGTAGYIGVQVVPQFHPEGTYLDDINFNYQPERIIQKYWRVSKPDGGSFDKGGRTTVMRCRYRDPQDIPGGALQLCFDLIYWMGGATSNWQRLSPPNSGAGFAENNQGTGWCGDRDIMNDEATYEPLGTDTSTTAYDIDGSISLGNYDLGETENNRYLLADVLVGQQGPAVQYYYSIADGAWNDPDTWSTEGYESSVNSTGSWPKRRLDVAKIGDGHTVTLNCNIGSGYAGYYGSDTYYEQRLGSCIIESNDDGAGRLNLQTYQIRASVFEMHDGGIVSTGIEEGIHEDLNRGNIIRQKPSVTIARDFNYEEHDNGNYVYTAIGKHSDTWDNATDENYCNVRSWYWRAAYAYIDDFHVDNGSSFSAPNVFEFNDNGMQRSWTSSNSDAGFMYWCDTTVRVTAGNTYTARIYVDNTGGYSFYCRMWVDTDFDGEYDDPGERFPSAGGELVSGGYADITFSIPADAPMGTTRLRVQLRYGSNRGPCEYPILSWWYGEVEDYTVFVTNNNLDYEQETGGDVPNQISSLTVEPSNSSATVTQTTGISVADEILIENGTFMPTTNPMNSSDIPDYSFSAASGDYESLTDAVSPSLSGGDADDGYYSNISLGFDFTYLNANYSTVSASTNGFLCFGSAAAVPGNDLASNGGAARPILAPLWDDLDLSSGNFSYKIEGDSPNKVFTAQWENVLWNSGAGSPVISFQVKLYEADGEIEFIYSRESGAVNSGSASAGITASATGAGNFISLSDFSPAPNESYISSTNNLSSKPAEGQIYSFTPASARLRLQGDFVNNNTNTSFGEGSAGTLIFDGSNDQKIEGSSETDFYNVYLDNSGEKIKLINDTRINNRLSFVQDNFLELNQKTLTLGSGAGDITSFSSSFSSSRMILSSTSGTVGTIKKEYTTAAGAKNYFFPIGVSDDYNPADISVTGSYAGTPAISLQLYSGKHPERLKEEMLEKYWNVDLDGIGSVSANSLSFTYLDSDVSGDTALYIPSLYKTSGDWEINLGDSPRAKPSPIEITNSPVVEGDWTAGQADVFFEGRIFWSRNSGSWSVPSNWSNDPINKHSGPAASYYPSQLFEKDTVIIDGHGIEYGVESGIIDTLRMGGPNNGISTAGRGILEFLGTPLNKYSLTISRNLFLDTDGRIESSTVAAGGRRDTLIVQGDIINNSDGTAGVDGGMHLFQGGDDFVVLSFTGDESATVSGEGEFGILADTRLDKTDGLSDTLTIMSNSFGEATGAVPYHYYPESGVTTLTESSSSLSLPSATFYLSSGPNDVHMGLNSGLNILDVAMISRSSLYSNSNTTINLEGGDLYVGDDVDEHFIYRNGTDFDVIDGRVDVAGCFERHSSGSLIDLSVESSGEIRVLKEGTTEIAKKGFNLANSSSTYSVDGGRIIIAKGAGTANPDYLAGAAEGLGMINGATVQAGDSVLTPPGNTIKVAGSTPIYNLHSVGVGANTVISSQILTISADWTIDDDHSAELRDNNVKLSGDLMNYGAFDPNASDVSTDLRQLTLTASSGTQTIYNEDPGGLELYNLRIDKSDGLVLLGGDNSNIIVRNNLEFSTENQVVIDARTNSQSVEMSPVGGSNPRVFRNGLGHIDGTMYRYFATGGGSSKKFYVGSDTLESFRPATISISGSGGSAGLIGVNLHNVDHTYIASSEVDVSTNVQRYWEVSENAAFDIGNRTYSIKTQYMNPGDLRNSPDLTIFEHNLYSPALPSTPPSSSWTVPQTQSRTDTTVTSIGLTEFGDIVIGEPNAIYYYSYQSGGWHDADTWSLDGYETKTTPIVDLPGESRNHFVMIGNGKTVTVPAGGPYPEVKAVVVEKYNDDPGALYIYGELGYVKSDNFTLNDDCTIAVQNMSGLENSTSVGAVRTDAAPNLNIGRYIFNSTYGKQNTGKALPETVKDIIVDNQSSAPNNIVFISTYSGAPDIYVNDSIYTENGVFNLGGRDIFLYGQLAMENNSSINPLTSDLTFASATFSPPSHTITLGNQVGANLYNLKLTGGDVYVYATSATDLDNAHIFVENLLEFDNASDVVLNVRTDDRKVVIEDGGSVTRTQSTGYVDGILQKRTYAGAGSYLFEIGNGSDYTPATVDFSGAGGSDGDIAAQNVTPVPDEPNIGNRLDPGARVPRYWSIIPDVAGGFDLGTRDLNLNLEFPASELGGLTLEDVVVRRKSIPAETPVWSQRIFSELSWSPAVASVELDAAATPWAGLGEFYIGEKAPRTFYSLQTGNWDENTTWTFNSSHSGAPVPTGVYPNTDASELEDNVEIGLDHIVTLNLTESNVDTLRIINNSNLDMQTNVVDCDICSSSGLFELADNGMISFGATSVPSATSTMANFADYVMSSGSTIEFYGTQTLPANPFGLSAYENVLINLSGTKLVTTPITINGDLTISNDATLRIQNIDALKVLNNVINSANLTNEGVIEIGEE